MHKMAGCVSKEAGWEHREADAHRLIGDGTPGRRVIEIGTDSISMKGS